MTDTETYFDMDLLVKKLDGDEELARELALVYCEDAPKRLAHLQEAVSRLDTEAAMKTAHSLKGMSGVVRVARLVNDALAIENAARRNDLNHLQRLLPPFSALLNLVIDQVRATLQA